VSSWNDLAQSVIFRPNHLAPTYSEAEVVKPPRFNAHYDIEEVKSVDVAAWKLELSGRIENKKAWTAQEIYALPEQEMIIKHICIEGWDYVGQWSGVNLKQFLQRVGADLNSKYLAFRCADGYTEALDMPSALHPQTMLATKYAREPIADPFGFPLRLRTATKIGFKNAKWITSIEVTNDFPETYYGKEGFNWFSGM
jgi:DMSO/TMAO reductase YedYZ molybdopterin-dependent catalytic subunit